MARTKATVRRLPPAAPQRRVGNKNILNRRERNIPFKIKKLLSQFKVVTVKKKPSSKTNEHEKKKHIFFRKEKTSILNMLRMS